MALAVFLAWTASPVQAMQETLDRVVAIAAGDVILLSDVRLAQALSLVRVRGQSGSAEEATIDALIDRALMLDEVRRYAPPEPDPSLVDRRLASVRGAVDAASFATALAAAGESEARLRERLREDLRIEAYLAQRFSAETPERTSAAIADWVRTLRRRADVVRASDR